MNRLQILYQAERLHDFYCRDCREKLCRDYLPERRKESVEYFVDMLENKYKSANCGTKKIMFDIYKEWED